MTSLDRLYGIPYNLTAMKPYGEKLRAERERSGFSIRELSEYIGCNKSSIVDWEKGKRLPTPIYQAKLAKCLGGSLRDEKFPVTPEYLAFRPEHIPEAAWIKGLQSVFKQQLSVSSEMYSNSGLTLADVEEHAAVLARQIQLWSHNVVPNPFGSGVHYRLTTNASGKKDWVSNVRKSESKEADSQD